VDQSSREAIDIHQALSILSDRSNPENHSSSHDKDGGCCHGASAPQNAKQMGQTIDLMAETKNKEAEISGEEREKEEQRIKEERAKRRWEIHEELNSMTVQELLQAVFKAQQDRVATYKDYERYESSNDIL
jgi:hypothetical protein